MRRGRCWWQPPGSDSRRLGTGGQRSSANRTGSRCSSGWVPSSGGPQPRIRTMGMSRGGRKKRSRQSGGECAITSTCERCAIRSSRCAASAAPTSFRARSPCTSSDSSQGRRSKKSAASLAEASHHGAALNQQDRRDAPRRQGAELDDHTIDGGLASADPRVSGGIQEVPRRNNPLPEQHGLWDR